MPLPSFKEFRSSSEAASRSKQRNRSRDTIPELLLRKHLSRLGFRYRLHARDVPGRPDMIFRARRVVVFCDGDFWHGRHWLSRRRKLARGANANYWVAKIEANMARDKRHNSMLKHQGWAVIRVWETDIRTHPDAVAGRIARVLAPVKKRS